MNASNWRGAWLALVAVQLGMVCMLSVQPAYAVPSFGRQTGLACEACHTAFPELTPFGRRFKLNGYVIDNMPQVKSITPENQEALLLNQIPPLSLMFQASYTKTKTSIPDPVGGESQNGQVLFPQQASLFYAGRIAPNFGGFIQVTYSSDSGSFGFDNTDIRYANHFNLFGSDTVYGIGANNNPTVQDVWNSTPAWQTPFDQKSSAAPVPAFSALVDGSLGGDVAGLSAYLWWNDSVYAEIAGYRSAPQGFSNNVTGNAGPLNSTANNVIDGVAPYWRLAYERDWGRNALSVGTYGLSVNLLPGNGMALQGTSNHFTDTALDAQYQYLGDEHLFSVQTTYIHEHQQLDASFAAGASNASDNVNTFRIGGSYYYQRKYGAGLGYFTVNGSTDMGLYTPGAVTGSATGSPNSSGWTAELDYLPWQNVKFALQYTLYNKFNGASTNYDGFGRNASDNNTLYLLAWINF